MITGCISELWIHSLFPEDFFLPSSKMKIRLCVLSPEGAWLVWKKSRSNHHLWLCSPKYYLLWDTRWVISEDEGRKTSILDGGEAGGLRTRNGPEPGTSFHTPLPPPSHLLWHLGRWQCPQGKWPHGLIWTVAWGSSLAKAPALSTRAAKPLKAAHL